MFSRYSFYILFAALTAIAIVSSFKIIALYAILLFLARYFVQIFVINKNSKVYNAGKFYFSLPLMDFATPLIDHIFMKRENKNKKR